jgi:hypothetical protein
METIDFRSLCEELHAAFNTYAVDECHHELLERARKALAQSEAVDLPPRVGYVLRLAEIIREVDGNHDKGAAALAEAILDHPDSRWEPLKP